jgi:translation elongation factor EF-Tu-like GTPase
MNPITLDPIKDLNAKKNSLKFRIVEYLNRVDIVDDSTTLTLLYETAELLKTLQINEAKRIINAHFKSMNSELKTILMSM